MPTKQKKGSVFLEKGTKRMVKITGFTDRGMQTVTFEAVSSSAKADGRQGKMSIEKFKKSFELCGAQGEGKKAKAPKATKKPTKVGARG